MRAHLTNIAIVTLLCGSPQLVLAATFQGPAQQPPSGNAPGVLWNMKDNPKTLQADAALNIPGIANDPVTSGLYLTNNKAFHVDQDGNAAYYMGNWGGGNGSRKPFTFHINGDIQVSDFGGLQGERGRIQATEFCFNPGSGPSDCISDWASAGGGGSGFVLKTGDTMTGKLRVDTQPTGSLGSYKNILSLLAPVDGSTFSTLEALDTTTYSPQTNSPAASVRGILANAIVNKANTRLLTANGMSGNVEFNSSGGLVTNINGADFTAKNTAGTVTNAYGVSAGVYAGGGTITSAYGVQGKINSGVNATNKYGVYGEGSNGIGVYGNGTTGIQGNGTNNGGYFNGSIYGISGISSGYAGGYFTGPLIGTIINSPATGVDVTVSSGSGAQRGVYIKMPNKGTGIDITNASTGLKASVVGVNAEGVSVNSTDVAVNAYTDGTSGPNNFAGWFHSPENGVTLAKKGGYGLSSTINTSFAAGEFLNGSTNKVYLSSSSYPVEVKTGNTQMFYINNNGEVHTNGGAYPGFYFHDRTSPATKFFTWYAESSSGVSYARLYSNAIGDVIKANQANGQVFNYANSASWNVTSDERLKDIHGSYTKGLEVLTQINPIIFNYKKNNPQKIESTLTHQGVSAQTLLKVLPEAVHMGEDGYLTVNNDPIIWASVNSIKQLKSENDELKAKIETLEQRLNKLEEKLK
ncbi:tail fiber domain-containing protein [Candidatus Uhrbacteria bacterium]|nr:tail fiber domain-containing protein [Candidatus Uhrbacteria bacterium]